MRLHIGKPIYPVATDLDTDFRLRMKAAREQMEDYKRTSTR